MRNPTEKLIAATLNTVRHASGVHRGSVHIAIICNNSAESRVSVKKRKAIDNRAWTRLHLSHVESLLGRAKTTPPVSPAANVAIVVKEDARLSNAA